MNSQLRKTISTGRLAEMLRSGGRVMLVDVRDSDYDDGGHIRGCVNIEARRLLGSPETLAYQFRGAQDVVFYCEYGQNRSVRCCEAIASILLSPTAPEPFDGQVYFLEGGFSSFRRAAEDLVDYA